MTGKYQDRKESLAALLFGLCLSACHFKYRCFLKIKLWSPKQFEKSGLHFDLTF